MENRIKNYAIVICNQLQIKQPTVDHRLFSSKNSGVLLLYIFFFCSNTVPALLFFSSFTLTRSCQSWVKLTIYPRILVHVCLLSPTPRGQCFCGHAKVLVEKAEIVARERRRGARAQSAAIEKRRAPTRARAHSMVPSITTDQLRQLSRLQELFKVQYDMIGGHEMAISKQYLQLFDVKPWSHHHQKATIERAPTTVTPPPRHAALRAGAPIAAQSNWWPSQAIQGKAVCQTNEKNCAMTSLAHPFYSQ